MSLNCINELAENIIPTCSPLYTGVADRMYAFNFNDVTLIRNASRDKVITSLALKPGRRGFIIEGRKNSNQIQDTGSGESIVPTTTQTLTFTLISEHSDRVLETIEQLQRAKLVIIAEQNGIFHAYGTSQGLQYQSHTADSTNTETAGSYQVVMVDNRALIKDVFGIYTNGEYDKNATMAALEDLVSPVSISGIVADSNEADQIVVTLNSTAGIDINDKLLFTGVGVATLTGLVGQIGVVLSKTATTLTLTEITKTGLVYDSNTANNTFTANVG